MGQNIADFIEQLDLPNLGVKGEVVPGNASNMCVNQQIIFFVNQIKNCNLFSIILCQVMGVLFHPKFHYKTDS